MEKQQTIITPPAKLSFGFKELWKYRELFYFFTWRDIKVKYKQTYLGIAWAVLQPLALMLLFTFVFAKNLHLDTGNVRYEVFVLSGLILWNLFYSSVSNASDSMIQQANMIKKIYFPRLIVPSSSLLAALFDFIIAFIIFLLFCLIVQQPLQWNVIVFYPLAIVLLLLTAFGLGTFLSALNVRYRDFRYVVPFLLQFLFFGSQVIYSIHSIHQLWLKYILALNPVNGAIELFRIPFGTDYDMEVIGISIASALTITFAGLIYFRKAEAYFADLV